MLDRQISQLYTQQKEDPGGAESLDLAIQDKTRRRDAITAKPTENLKKLLAKLNTAAQGCSEPQEMDDMTEVLVKK